MSEVYYCSMIIYAFFVLNFDRILFVPLPRDRLMSIVSHVKAQEMRTKIPELACVRSLLLLVDHIYAFFVLTFDHILFVPLPRECLMSIVSSTQFS